MQYPILSIIRQNANDPSMAHCPDPELLARFLRGDEMAFGAILHRHGPMVFDVCRGVLGNEADAEDAFQAVFLVLARQATTICKAGSLAAWLHGVARRTALKCRAAAMRRRDLETRLPAKNDATDDQLTWADVRQTLHDELAGLPERFRGPLILCYLQGLTQDRAATELGLSKGTIKRRLERGRALLRARLAGRGLGAVAILAASAWPADARVPPVVLAATRRFAAVVAAGGEVASVIPAKVAALAAGSLQTMSIARLKASVALILLVGVLGAGTGLLARRIQAAQPPTKDTAPPPARVEKAPEVPKKDDLGGLRGTWAFVRIESRGPDRVQTIPFDGERDTWTIDGKKMIQETRGDDGKVRKVGEFAITLDVDAKPPRLTLQTTHPDRRSLHFIYEVKGDTLRMCSYALAEVNGVGLIDWPNGFDLDKFDKDDVEKLPCLQVFKRVGATPLKGAPKGNK